MTTGYFVMYGVFSAILIALVLKIVRSFNHKRRDEALASRQRRAVRPSWRDGDHDPHATRGRPTGSDYGSGHTIMPLAAGGYAYTGASHKAPQGQCSSGVQPVAPGGDAPGDGGACGAGGSDGGDGGSDGGDGGASD